MSSLNFLSHLTSNQTTNPASTISKYLQTLTLIKSFLSGLLSSILDHPLQFLHSDLSFLKPPNGFPSLKRQSLSKSHDSPALTLWPPSHRLLSHFGSCHWPPSCATDPPGSRAPPVSLPLVLCVGSFFPDIRITCSFRSFSHVTYGKGFRDHVAPYSILLTLIFLLSTCPPEGVCMCLSVFP